MRSLTALFLVALFAGIPGAASAQDSFTLYELLEPASHSFAITYDTTTTRAGAEYYLNPVRAGAEVSDERVVELATGKELQWELVTGAQAKADGLLPERASDDGQYLRIRLANPVPDGAEARLRIFKTYRDPASYRIDGDTIVFERGLGIRANAVVLPPGYELVGSAVPAIVSTLGDGRVKVSFLNDRDDTLPVRLVGRRLGDGDRVAAPDGGSR